MINIQLPANIHCNVKPFVICIHGTIDHHTYLQCRKDFELALRVPIPYLFLKIDSPGGKTKPGFKIGELIQNAKKRKKVITIGYRVHSMASYLFALGDIRYIDKERGSILIHDIIVSTRRDRRQKASVLFEEIKDHVLNAELIFTTISLACGKDKHFIKNKLDETNNTNIIWSPEDAFLYGFCHYLHVPTIEYIVTDKVLIDGGTPLYQSSLKMSRLHTLF